jgi:transposase-like protein
MNTRYDTSVKEFVLAQSAKPGVNTAQLARSLGICPKIAYKWRQQAGITKKRPPSKTEKELEKVRAERDALLKALELLAKEGGL